MEGAKEVFLKCVSDFFKEVTPELKRSAEASAKSSELHNELLQLQIEREKLHLERLKKGEKVYAGPGIL